MCFYLFVVLFADFVSAEANYSYLYQPELPQMITVVGRVDDVRVVKLAEGVQLVHHPLDGGVHRLQSLQTLRHQQVRELAVDGAHLVRHLQDPLLVWIGGVIVRWRTEKKSKIIRVVGRAIILYFCVLLYLYTATTFDLVRTNYLVTPVV